MNVQNRIMNNIFELNDTIKVNKLKVETSSLKQIRTLTHKNNNCSKSIIYNIYSQLILMLLFVV